MFILLSAYICTQRDESVNFFVEQTFMLGGHMRKRDFIFENINFYLIKQVLILRYQKIRKKIIFFHSFQFYNNADIKITIIIK
jgi:hypothetical protein